MMVKYAIPFVLAALASAGSSGRADVPFDVPWIGYDTAVHPEGLFPVSSRSADFNADGVPDLATVSLGGTAWLSVLPGDGEGGYLPPDTYPLAIESMDLATGDFDGDGVVDTADLLMLLAAWGDCPDPPEECPADLDGDGTVGTADLLILLSNWS
ncbi:MAG: FG-GAP-like repeat-containing protein [Planctomycetota bacterium]|nr:FG-GAP-like repeat-containing protein [Planctomycetota bacterium]